MVHYWITTNTCSLHIYSVDNTFYEHILNIFLVIYCKLFMNKVLLNRVPTGSNRKYVVFILRNYLKRVTFFYGVVLMLGYNQLLYKYNYWNNACRQPPFHQLVLLQSLSAVSRLYPILLDSDSLILSNKSHN